jgi:dihydroflavonol-4-reductase
VKCFVTGATGFIGSNLVSELIARGHEVKALIRPGADTRALEGLAYEPIEGDLSNRAWLAAAMKGCDWCFHVAALYALWLRDYKPMIRANIDGTRNALHAAADAGCERIVYTSTVGVLRPPGMKRTSARPSDELDSARYSDMTNEYKRTKWRAEEIARNLAAKAPIVIVNPTAPVGPRDLKPTPTGKIIVDFLNGAMPAYLNTGLNWVHVRDVAVGHILAAEKGRIGERYILGNEEGNWTLKQALDELADLTGLKAPRLAMPRLVAMAAARASETMAFVTRSTPRVPVAGVRMAKYKMFFTPEKAIRELGLPQTSPRQALADAVDWFVKHGFVKAPERLKLRSDKPAVAPVEVPVA